MIGFSYELLFKMIQVLKMMLMVVCFHSLAYASDEDKSVEDMLAVKFKLGIDHFDHVQLNRGGGYDLVHTKWEVGNLLASLSYEDFDLTWQEQEKLPFASGVQHPIASVKKYTLKTHIPYRINDQKMWLGHVGAELAYEKEYDRALSLQAFLLYSEYFSELGSWQLGMVVNYHPVETVVLPIVEYSYNYPFTSRSDYYGHLGFPKTQVGYFIHKRLRTELGLVYHQATVQLADDSAIEPAGFFQSKNWRADWRSFYQFSSELEFVFGLQASVTNKLVLYDQGHRQKDHFYGSHGSGVSLGMIYEF